MDILWAPWRMEYIVTPKTGGCIFCDKPKQDHDRDNLVLYRGQHNFIIMNYYPYNNGHLMVVPYRHINNIELLTTEEHVEMMQLLQQSSRIIKENMNAEGFNIGMNLGRIAGAGIDEHIHFHIVPRWSGDTNFMPVTAHTKVDSQGLAECWSALLPHFQNINLAG